MDQISSDSLSRYALAYQHGRSQAQPSADSGHQAAQSFAASRSSQGSNPSQAGYANLFGEDELSKLQSNLEAIARLAESALKRLDR